MLNIFFMALSHVSRRINSFLSLYHETMLYIDLFLVSLDSSAGTEKPPQTVKNLKRDKYMASLDGRVRGRSLSAAD